MDDEVMQAIKRKRDASMLRAIELVRDGEAAGVVSTGNTKILVAAGTLRLRTLEGIERPSSRPSSPATKPFHSDRCRRQSGCPRRSSHP